MNSICVICRKPNQVWVDFLSKFTHYDIYIMVDDNSENYTELFSSFSNINILQVNNEECEKHGFQNMTFCTTKKNITAWEKAVYYFSTINTKYQHIWFMEDDVLFYNEQTLLNIDLQYNDHDLLSSSYGENINGSKDTWHWCKINIEFPPPYYCAIGCCVRMSADFIARIKDYANKHKTLFFLEALFPTLCMKYTMKYSTPSEFNRVAFRQNIVSIDEINIFHPVKQFDKHDILRRVVSLLQFIPAKQTFRITWNHKKYKINILN